MNEVNEKSKVRVLVDYGLSRNRRSCRPTHLRDALCVISYHLQSTNRTRERNMFGVTGKERKKQRREGRLGHARRRGTAVNLPASRSGLGSSRQRRRWRISCGSVSDYVSCSCISPTPLTAHAHEKEKEIGEGEGEECRCFSPCTRQAPPRAE